MTEDLLIRGARQLITLNGPPGPRRGAALNHLALIEDGSVLVSGGKVASVGPTRRIENLAQAKQAREFDASGHVVMPAFVDSHVDLLRDSADRPVTARTLDARAQRILRMCVRHGTVSLEARSGSGRDESADLRALRTAAGLEPAYATVVPVYSAPSTGSEQGREAQLNWFEASLLPRLEAKRLARFAGALCGGHGFSAAQTRRYLQLCHALGIDTKLEVAGDSTSEGIAAAVEYRTRVVEGLIDATSEQAGALASSGAIATLLPVLALAAGGRYPPARTLIDSGVPVALASGFSPGEASTFSLQPVIAIACSQMRMTAAEAVAAATINGAHALGIGESTGSLQWGKDADLIVLNVSDYRDIALYFGCNLVAMTMKKGRIVYCESKVE